MAIFDLPLSLLVEYDGLVDLGYGQVVHVPTGLSDRTKGRVILVHFQHRKNRIEYLVR